MVGKTSALTFTYLWLHCVRHAHSWAINAIYPERMFESKIFQDDGIIAHAT